jgi:hypothetical protein
MEADRDEPEHQADGEAKPASETQPGGGVQAGSEAATRGPVRPGPAMPSPERSHEPEATGEATGKAASRPFDPELEREAGE